MVYGRADGLSTNNKRIMIMNEKTRKILIDRAMSWYSHRNISRADVVKIVEDIPFSEYNPRLVEKEICADEERLFGNVSDVIDYLSAYKDCKLRQEWSGYEDNYFVFDKKVIETDEEIIDRLHTYVGECVKSLLRKRDEQESLKKKKKEYQDKISELDRKLK